MYYFINEISIWKNNPLGEQKFPDPSHPASMVFFFPRQGHKMMDTFDVCFKSNSFLS